MLLDGIPRQEVEKIAWKNAADLFRHPVPADVQSNPDAF